MENCREPLKSIVIFAINTGMRLSEILNLTWDDVDLERGFITVRNTKNGEIRYLPMNTTLRDLLRQLKKDCRKSNIYVFGNLQGSNYRRYTISHWFKEVVRTAGIQNFHFHDLRHTFASYLVMAGVDIMTVKELLGHKTLDMTLRYSHLSPSFQRQAIELLDKRMDTFWTPEANSSKQSKSVIGKNHSKYTDFSSDCRGGSVVEHPLGKGVVVGSIPIPG